MRPIVFGCLAFLTVAAATSAMGQQGKLAEVEHPGAARHQPGPFRTDIVDVVLAAAGDAGKKHQIEYMVRMKAGEAIVYSWEAPSDADVWHEFHGHTASAVTFYKKAAGPAHHGSLVAPFEGIHGWYYENRTNRPVTVKLKLSGHYELVAAK